MKIIFNFRHVMAAVFRKMRLKKLREIKVVRKERKREREISDFFTFFFRTFVEKFYRQPNVSCCKLLFNCESAT